MNTRKPVLGRGLSALLPGKDDVPRGTYPREVEIGRLTPSRFQPRRDFSEAALADLARSIREQGIVQPIVVVARGEKFEIVAGERRWRAASMAGLERVPITVREKSSDRDLLEAALVENLQREDLNVLEAAEAYARLREEFQLTQEKIAERVGKDRATVANTLRILKLSCSSSRENPLRGALGGPREGARRTCLDRRPGAARRGDRSASAVRPPDREARRAACRRGQGYGRAAPRSVHSRRRGEAFPAPPDEGSHRSKAPRRENRNRIRIGRRVDRSLRASCGQVDPWLKRRR